MAGNEVRAPDAVVTLNGVTIPGLLSADVTNTSFLGADRFRARFSLSASGPTVWSQPSLLAAISFGLDGGWVNPILGQVDRITIDPIAGEVCIDGRDLSAQLMAARTQESFENRTSSEVATILATRHGLVPQVAPTTTLIGRYYQNDHTRTTLNQHGRVTTEWDLLVWLAALEGFEVWVSGQALNFVPEAQSPVPIVVAPEDCSALWLERDFGLDQPLTVIVKSWNGRTQTLVQAIATSDTTGGVAADYIIVKPNLTNADAQSLAQRTLAQMLAHGRTVTFDMPGDLTTAPRDTVQLVATGTDFDGIYVVTDVQRRLSMSHGFSQTVEARLPAWTAF